MPILPHERNLILGAIRKGELYLKRVRRQTRARATALSQLRDMLERGDSEPELDLILLELNQALGRSPVMDEPEDTTDVDDTEGAPERGQTKQRRSSKKRRSGSTTQGRQKKSNKTPEPDLKVGQIAYRLGMRCFATRQPYPTTLAIALKKAYGPGWEKREIMRFAGRNQATRITYEEDLANGDNSFIRRELQGAVNALRKHAAQEGVPSQRLAKLYEELTRNNRSVGDVEERVKRWGVGTTSSNSSEQDSNVAEDPAEAEVALT